MRIRRFLVAGLIVATVGLGAASRVDASSITLADSVTLSSVTVTDGDFDGLILFNGSLGIWNVTVTQGTTKPALGAAGQPVMDLQVFASSTQAGTLTVSFSEGGFSLLPGKIVANFSATTLASGSVATYDTYDDLALSSALTSQSLSGPGSPSASTKTVALTASSSPYPLTQVVKITHTGATDLTTASNVEARLTAPDGGWTVAMLGSVLLAIGLMRRRLGVR